MKRLLALILAVMLSATAYGQFTTDFPVSNTSNANSTGLVVNQASNSPTWKYERYSYWQCGREYYGYRPTLQAATPAGPIANSITPIGSVNTDNSTTHSYTYNITYGQLPVAQGNTLYGYSYSSVADVYGNTDIGALYQQAIRLAGDATVYADKANGNAMSLVAQAGRERTKVAEILAKGQVIAQANASAAALAASVSPGPEVNVVNQHTVTQGNGETVVNKEPAPVAPGSVQKIFDQHCVKCHRQGAEKGGLALDDAGKLSGQQVAKILQRCTTANPDLRMPKGDGNGPALSLSVDELALLFKAASN